MNKVDFELSIEESLEMHVDENVTKGETGRNRAVARCDSRNVDRWPQNPILALEGFSENDRIPAMETS